MSQAKKSRKRPFRVETGDGRQVDLVSSDQGLVVVVEGEEPAVAPQPAGLPVVEELGPEVPQSSPIEREAAAGYSVRWGLWNRAVGCPVTGEQLGQPQRWLVFQGMAGLSDEGARQAAPVLAGWAERLNGEPGEPSEYEKDRGICSGLLCTNNQFEHEGEWYEVEKRGPYEVAVGVRAPGQEKHVPPEAGEDLAPRLGRTLDEFYGRVRARHPKPVPPAPTAEELKAHRQAEAEERAIRLLARSFHGNTTRARLLLDTLRAVGVQLNVDNVAPAAAQGARA